MHQQPAEQRGVGARLNPQKQIGVFRRIGAARIDHHDARAALAACWRPCAGTAPDGTTPHWSRPAPEIGLVEILVAAGHGVGAEGAAVAGDRRRHAQPRIGVDIGAADEPLHQLVGDVIILGQQLAGQIERDRARAVAGDDMRKAMRDMVERIGPRHPLQSPPLLQRIIGCSRRSPRPSVSPSAEPFEHSRPKLAG